jgi:DNA-binding transcriptional LysR family regulator
VAMVPESARMLHFSGSVLRPMKMHPVYAELYLVWRKDNENPALPGFCRIARSHFSVAQ